MTRQNTIVGAIVIAIVGGAATVFSERILDVFVPKIGAETQSVFIEPTQTTVKYPDEVQLVAQPNLRSWGVGKSAVALATATREQVAKGLKLPVDMSGMEIHYQIFNVAFGGHGKKRSASIKVHITDQEKGYLKCGPDIFAFRDEQELSQQIEQKLSSIIYQSFKEENLSCG